MHSAKNMRPITPRTPHTTHHRTPADEPDATWRILLPSLGRHHDNSKAQTGGADVSTGKGSSPTNKPRPRVGRFGAPFRAYMAVPPCA